MLSLRKMHLNWLLIIVIITFITSLIGCHSTVQDRAYELYLIEESDINFSFEYPEELESIVYRLEDDFLKFVGFSGLVTNVVEGTTLYREWAHIDINIIRQGEIVPSAESEIEKVIETNEKYPGFHVGKKYETKINGIKATVLYYSFSGQVTSVEESFGFNDIVWSTYFEQNGYIWIIEYSYPLKMSTEAEADFKHMLKTFKILD